MLLLVPVVIACAEPARSVEPVRAPDRSAGALAAGCPGGFGAIMNGTPCDQPLQCAFAEGTCACAPGSYCGGAAPDPEQEAELLKLRWTCTPTPPTVRADGCPGVEPASDKLRCATDGQTCSYGDCCSFSYHCTKGRWIRGEANCPP